MPKLLKLLTNVIVLLLASASASAIAQTQTPPQIVKAETRDLPSRLARRTVRTNAILTPRVATQQEIVDSGKVFKQYSPSLDGASIVKIQSGGSLSWTQWGKDPQHTGFINIEGQSFDALLADKIYDPNAPASAAD